MECTLERCLLILILRTEISLIPLGGAGLSSRQTRMADSDDHPGNFNWSNASS